MDVFEAACSSLADPSKRSEAEAYLIRIRNSTDAASLYLNILYSSQLAVAQFHAASGLGVWSLVNYSTNRDFLIKTRSDLISWVNGSVTTNYVRQEICHVIALITKRSWIDDSEKDQNDFLFTIFQLLKGNDSNKSTALTLMAALLNEFSSDKATNVGLPAQYHFICRKMFQVKVLDMFSTVISLMHAIIVQNGVLDSSTSVALGHCFVIVEKILSWEFVNEADDGAIQLLKPSKFEDDGANLWSIVFPESWREPLTRFDVIQIFFKGHELLGAENYKSRQCLIQLASISGKTFDSSSEFLSVFVKLFLGLLTGYVVKSQSRELMDEDELLGITQIMKRLLHNHGFEDFGVIPEYMKLLEELGKTSLLILSFCTPKEDDPLIESLDDILDIWATLIQEADILQCEKATLGQEISTFSFPAIMGLISNISAAIWLEYVNFIVRFAELNALDDDENEHGLKDQDIFIDALTNSAVIGRINPAMTIPKLLELLGPRIQLLEQLLKVGKHDQRLPVLFEQLHWLLMLSGHFLADPPIGETPMIPMSILKFSKSQGGFMEDPVVTLSKMTLHLLEVLSVQSGTQGVFYCNSLTFKFELCSPTLVETLFWFVKRWCRTYLLMDTSDYPFFSDSILHTFGYPGEGPQVLNYLLEKIHSNMIAWNSEPDIVEQLIVCLKCFSFSANIRKLMLSSDKFSALVTFFLNNLALIPSSIQSLLIETIATIATHASTPELRDSYFSGLSGAIESNFSALVARSDFNAVFKQQSFMEKVVNVLEMYDGLCMAADEMNSFSVFEACSKHFSSFTKLLDLYHNFPEFELYILRIFSHLAAHLSFETLNSAQKNLFYGSISELIKVYHKNESRKFSIRKYKYQDRKRGKGKDNEEELFEDLSCILQMLANLITGEYEGLDKPQILAQRETKIGDSNLYQVAFYGIGLVMPLVTEDMLRYPTLCKDYIYLVTEILEYFPDKLVEMDVNLLSSLSKSLVYGINHSIFHISSCAFDAIVSIGFYSWFEMTKFGNEKIQAMANHLDEMMQQTFKYIIFEDFDSNLISHAGDALFGLAMARQNSFRLLVEQLLAQQPNPVVQGKLSIEFQTLTKVMIHIADLQHSDIIQGKLSIGFGEFYGTNKTLLRFKEYHNQFLLFVLHVRGILRVK